MEKDYSWAVDKALNLIVPFSDILGEAYAELIRCNIDDGVHPCQVLKDVELDVAPYYRDRAQHKLDVLATHFKAHDHPSIKLARRTMDEGAQYLASGEYSKSIGCYSQVFKGTFAIERLLKGQP
jgi:hypothetical protein